jgi:class 3 adenylate cyclase
MRIRDGTGGAKLLLVVLLSIYFLGVFISLRDKLARVGRPDVGWMLEGGFVSPTRHDASDAGLRGGGRVLAINGEPVPELHGRSTLSSIPQLRVRAGEQNTMRFQTPAGEIRELTLPVRPWRWGDAVFTEGATALIGLLFFVVGATAFFLRPYETASWALLILCSLSSGILTTLLIPIGHRETLATLYFMTVAGFIAYVPFHTGLALPVVHPLLRRRPYILKVIYGIAALQVALYIGAWFADWTGMFRYARSIGSMALLLSIALFVGRCVQLSWYSEDRLVAQRARILLAGTVFGLAPVAFVQFMQETFNLMALDNRFLYWPMALFLLALSRVTVRYDLMNARVAVRRAVIYGWVVGFLTLVAWLLSYMAPYAVALMLLPLLYLWPRFEQRLSKRFYPTRARFPELIRSLGNQLAASTSVREVLDTLAAAPALIADAVGGVAFLLASDGQEEQSVRSGGNAVTAGPRLSREPLVQLLTTTRMEIFRSTIAVETQYANIAGECYACFDRLDGEGLLPLLRDNRVIGALALGARASGDVYERPEIDALLTVAQQAVQALIRIEATDRLRARELEFAELNRFFSPQVIDQVMARGGAAELRTQRRPVTVFFADLRGFTSFSDAVEPEEVMTTLTEYHNAMGRRIAEYAGTLERFAGDGFMVFFNDPVEQEDHVDRAVRMALAMRRDVRYLRDNWLRKGYNIDVGMGIHTGYATCGFIGYEGRRDYGVIGNVTNLAARLSDAAGGGEILVTTRVVAELRNGCRTEAAGQLSLKGFQQPQAVHRLLDL